MDTKHIIRSGTIFIIITDDPKDKPLSSFTLLQLQWHLCRVAAMQGAAEEHSDIDNDEDEDGSIAVRSHAALRESLLCDLPIHTRPARSSSCSRPRSSSRSRSLLRLPENIRPRGPSRFRSLLFVHIFWSPTSTRNLLKRSRQIQGYLRVYGQLSIIWHARFYTKSWPDDHMSLTQAGFAIV